MATATYSVNNAFGTSSITSDHEEASLILKIVMGHRELFGDLVQPHLNVLRRVVQRKLQNTADVEDVVQQTILKAFIHLDQFRLEACFRTWLVRISLNEVAQNWRMRRARRWVSLETPALAASPAKDPCDSPLRAYERSQTIESLRHAMNGLPEKYRVVVRMRDLEERSISEVAKALCLSIGAVKSRHHRGRRRMAQILLRHAALERRFNDVCSLETK
jgi:RNA polymerase sigma-70 factor (ECF subfamily)